jgi:hypothetical protein
VELEAGTNLGSWTTVQGTTATGAGPNQRVLLDTAGAGTTYRARATRK